MAKPKNLAGLLIDRKYWPFYFLFVVAVSVFGIGYLWGAAIFEVPPLCNFVDENGKVFIPEKDIKDGEEVFHLRGLMNYGSFLGDGGERGPDYTADSLHRIGVAMIEYYENERGGKKNISVLDRDAILMRVRRELRTNTYNEAKNVIPITRAMQKGFDDLYVHFTKMFTEKDYPEVFVVGYIKDPVDLKRLTSFFFWGAWLSAAARPGEDYSYTHNWPYDPLLGNLPTAPVMMWSFLSIICLFVGIGIILYVYGQFRQLQEDPFDGGKDRSLTTQDLEEGNVRPTQRATYKFFAFAMVVFLLQVLAGIASAADFVRPFGFSLSEWLPFTVSRSYHCILQIYWFFMCWVGYTIFFLPRVSVVPTGQRFLIEVLFLLSFVVGMGAVFGIYMGQMGIITGETAYWFGSQGWEFMELGRFFQLLMLGAFCLWIFIIYRSVSPWLNAKNMWSVPAWLLYGSLVMVLFLFFGINVTPASNFIVSDFWRWMVVHMWVEVTFEVFTTVIIAYLIVEMGLVTRPMAERVIFIAVMMFFITAIVGIAHNFYWIAKPTGVIAFGSVFSTLQVLPLLLLTLDAWKMQCEVDRAAQHVKAGKQKYAMNEVFLFILGVNFWNVFGAGMFGSLVNLPIVNYFEHGTYMTGNHAHGAMFGVKGNVALGGMLFCAQHLLKKEAWNPSLVRFCFWALNIGIFLMMFLSMFPVGIYQLAICLQEGFWAARSQNIVTGPVFKFFVSFRIIGGSLFLFGGVVPLVWFIVTSWFSMKPETPGIEGEKAPKNQLWAQPEGTTGDDEKEE